MACQTVKDGYARHQLFCWMRTIHSALNCQTNKKKRIKKKKCHRRHRHTRTIQHTQLCCSYTEWYWRFLFHSFFLCTSVNDGHGQRTHLHSQYNSLRSYHILRAYICFFIGKSNVAAAEMAFTFFSMDTIMLCVVNVFVFISIFNFDPVAFADALRRYDDYQQHCSDALIFVCTHFGATLV